MKVTEDLVNRFLTWPVPASVHPDGTPGQPGRTGTNLMTAIEARAMLEHVLGPVVESADPIGYVDAKALEMLAGPGLSATAFTEIAVFKRRRDMATAPIYAGLQLDEKHLPAPGIGDVPQPTHRDVCDRVFESIARVERVIYIAGGLTDPGELGHDLELFLEELLPEDAARLFGSLPSSVAEALDNDDIEGLCEWLMQQGFLGYLVQMATPHTRRVGDVVSYSWGYYKTRWFYAETVLSAMENGLAWAKKQQSAGDQAAPR